MKHIISTLALFCCAAALSAAEPLFRGENLSDFQGLPAGKAEMSGGILKIEKNDKRSVITTKEFFPVDPEKGYEFSCLVRADEKVSKAGFRGVVMGVVCCDAKGRKIGPVEVLTKPELTAELAEPVKAGAKTLLVRDASLWNAQNGFVVFDARKDMSDLPNGNRIRIAKIKRKDDLWEITLDRSLRCGYRAGALVRNHFDGAIYLCAKGGRFHKERWVPVKLVLKGIAAQGEMGNSGKFRAGTVKAGLVFLTGPKLNETFELKDIRITPVE
ncbi:MAG: hypothetical protein IJU70_06060 [Lentisphaeria bacterium]|nr:hypothetical protein [Lentisphaeria bacterium]